MNNEKLTGIYGYFDTLKCKIIYIGKDSNIEKKTRHKAHYYPSRYDEQPINRILQNDKVGRYRYVEFDKGYYDNDILNEKEIYWISYFNPKQNYNEGGDGFTSGDKHPNRKPYGRVVKGGIEPSTGKQKWILLDKESKHIKHSYNKNKLQELADELNKGIITVEKITYKKKTKFN